MGYGDHSRDLEAPSNPRASRLPSRLAPPPPPGHSDVLISDSTPESQQSPQSWSLCSETSHPNRDAHCYPPCSLCPGEDRTQMMPTSTRGGHLGQLPQASGRIGGVLSTACAHTHAHAHTHTRICTSCLGTGSSRPCNQLPGRHQNAISGRRPRRP